MDLKNNTVINNNYTLPVITSSGEYIIDLNEKCNNACLFCSSAQTIGRRPASRWKEIRQKIKDACEKGYQKINFFGGEPTVYEFLPKAVKYTSSLNLQITLNTNARKFFSSDYARQFKMSNLLQINTSLHHWQPKLHDKITQINDSFHQTIKGFKNIVKLEIPLLVNVVITALNYRDLPEIADFLNGLSIKNVKFSGLVSVGRILNNLQLFVPLRKIKPFLLEAFLKIQKNNQRAAFEKLPFCLAPQKGARYIFDKPGETFFQKLTFCEKCRFNKLCNGIDKKHLEIFPEEQKFIKKLAQNAKLI